MTAGTRPARAEGMRVYMPRSLTALVALLLLVVASSAEAQRVRPRRGMRARASMSTRSTTPLGRGPLTRSATTSAMGAATMSATTAKNTMSTMAASPAQSASSRQAALAAARRQATLQRQQRAAQRQAARNQRQAARNLARAQRQPTPSNPAPPRTAATAPARTTANIARSQPNARATGAARPTQHSRPHRNRGASPQQQQQPSQPQQAQDGLGSLRPHAYSNRANLAQSLGALRDKFAFDSNFGFSGVMDVRTRNLLIRPSGSTLQRDGRAPSGRVAMRGGHGELHREYVAREPRPGAPPRAHARARLLQLYASRYHHHPPAAPRGTLMTRDDHDPHSLDDMLGALAGSDDLDGARRDAIRRRAHDELEEARTRPTVFRRYAAPVFVAAVVLLHISWALSTTFTILK